MSKFYNTANLFHLDSKFSIGLIKQQSQEKKMTLNGRIQKLQKHVSDQITSQQIIPTLHQCVKQLIDNSIDAKATIIKIQLQEYGKLNFSVFDNGCGIQDVQKLGEGGNTSKLKIDQNKSSQYLQGIRTLGFRGQAVNSIANLCKSMIIHTVFEKNDNQNEQKSKEFIEVKYSVQSRKIVQKKKSFSKSTFTRISVQGLFHTLPVRKHQLDNKPKQNIKKVYDMVFQISLIYPQVTFILTNIVQGKQQILFNIQRNNSQKSNHHLIDIDYFYRDLPKQLWKQRIQICFPKKLDQCLTFIKNINIQGFILNTIDSGSTRKNLKFNKNYQYTFINRRPINPLKQICKIFDGYYKKYNPYTKYAFFLNLRVQPNQIDVNLSPNKRDIFIKKQRLEQILKQIRNSIQKEVIQKIINLEEFKEAKIRKLQSRSQKKNEKQEQKEDSFEDKEKTEKTQRQKATQDQASINIRKQAFRSNISQSVQDRSMKGNYLANYRPINNPANNSMIEQLNRRMNNTNINLKADNKLSSLSAQKDSQKVKEQQRDQSQEQNSESQDQNEEQQRQKQQKIIVNNKVQGINMQKLKASILQNLENVVKPEQNKAQMVVQNKKKSYHIVSQQKIQQLNEQKNNQQKNSSQKILLSNNKKMKSYLNNDELIKEQQKQFIVQKMPIQNNQDQKKNLLFKKSELNQIKHQKQSCCSQINHIKQSLNQQQNLKQKSYYQNIIKSQNQIPKFQLPQNLNYITEEIGGQITKNDFKNFHIHGQFNKGFILCSLQAKNYLYIVDQHASQEKRLFQSYMESKPDFYLFSKQIEITPLQVDQIQMARQQLTKSGFIFAIENRSTLKLVRCPNYFKKNFGLYEFMQIVQTNRNIKQIPSFYNSAASKACRSAVMIGDQLIKSRMENIVHRMSDLKSPWNCPHGRPSLISLGSFKSIISRIDPPKRVYKF